MDEGNSRRSLSPYHEKCFPPYCDNAQQVDKAMVAKMARGDLEDKYITFADENLELKKQNRNQERQIQRLQTAIQRQDKLDKRSGLTPTSHVADGNKVAILEAQNKNLQAKIKVLKQQLMNHSYIHSKEGRINDAKTRQGKTPRESDFQISQPQSAREPKPDRNVAALKMRVAELENQLEAQKNKYKGRIAQLEKELSALEKEAGKSGTSVNEQLSETSRQVKDNKELIKLRMQAEKQAAELEELREKLAAAEEEMDRLRKELKETKDRADDLEKQLEKERNKSRDAISEASRGTTHMETIRALEEQIRDLQKERDTLKDANDKLLQLTQSKSERSLKAPSGHSLQISQLDKNLKEKLEELEEKEARIKELERQLAEAEKALEDAKRALAEADKLETSPITPSPSSCPSKKECENCVDLSKKLCSALMDSAKLKAQLEGAQKPKTPTPTPKVSDTNSELDRLRDEVESLKEQINDLNREIESLKEKKSDLENNLADVKNKLSDASTELETLRPIVAEHAECSKAPLPTTSPNEEELRKEKERLEDELNNLLKELDRLRPIAAEHEQCLLKTPLPSTSSKENALKKEKERLEDELNNLLKEIEKLKAEQEDADALKKEKERLEGELNDLQKEIDKLQAEKENEDALRKEKERLEDELNDLLKELEKLRFIAAEHEQCRKTPLPSTSSKDDALKRQNVRLEDELNRAWTELNVLRPIAEEHKRSCHRDPTPTSSKSVQAPSHTSHVSSVKAPSYTSHVSFKEELQEPPPQAEFQEDHEPSPVTSEDSVHSKRTIDSERYLALSRQLQEALWENERLKKELAGRDDDDALKKQNQQLEDELNKALRELKEVMPVVEEHNRNCPHRGPEYARSFMQQYPRETSSPPSLAEYPKGASIHSKEKSKTPSRQASPVQSMSSRAPPPRPDYVSHVSPPPSVHCAETVDLNDPAQKANLLIVSKHDFDTVLMQKKRYSTEVEVVEPVDGRQTLNCKLEICMYDLDIEDKMLEYLKSLQSEPKIYVEWSFVGLDQRTAPLPAEQALFYTNVMYYGPLSSEIKNYLNKVEMPIDLYLVRTNSAPMKVAEGTLDMLPAMEQPNRGFMRSASLRGKDLPSSLQSDRAVATIHCSFILHECCLGDPPFRDQLEVAIGTLYLKNRDGGVVPDHATHIYIEYALLGHCGPDLETDSVPRGEVMKFNHSKKLRVNDENAPHLKSMLNDSNPRPLRFTVLAEPCSLTTDTEVETVGHADVNLNEEMIRKDRDLISSQVPVYSNEGEHLGTLSVTVLGIGTLQQIYGDERVPAR